MKTSMITPDGKPFNKCCTVTEDHSVTTFIVSVRSLNTVGETSIKDLIEKKFEVVGIERVARTVVVK